jgi:LuxR family maltose regulon positive regulatory protein
VGLLWQDEPQQAKVALEAARDASESAGLELTLVNALGHLGLAAAVAGRLREATDWADRCIALAEARGWSGLEQTAAGYLALALVAILRNDIDEAERLLALGLRMQRSEGEAPVQAALRIGQAAVELSRRRFGAARDQLDLLPGDTDRAPEPTLIRRSLASTEAELALATGSHAPLRSRLERLDPDARSYEQTLYLARARLADGEAEGLERLLVPVARQRRDLPLAVMASVVQALSADRLQRDNATLEALVRALSEAAPEHLVAPFAAVGTGRLPALLERIVLLRTIHSGFARTLLEDLAPTATGLRPGTTMEQVTEREKAVLRYLATMLSNAEIAEQMFRSPNTIKVHLRHLYRKLDVTSRRAAVRRARELRLFDDDDSA